jgi:hypothetical protein
MNQSVNDWDLVGSDAKRCKATLPDLGLTFSFPTLESLKGEPSLLPPVIMNAPMAPSASPVDGWKCLDSSHTYNGRACKCRPPPSEEEETSYELAGDPGKKNGEKKLRSYLAR